MSATFTASAMPEILSRGSSVRRKSMSLSTAKGGAKVPTKFFTPRRLTPFFTPTPESFWARTVVGIRMCRMPRWVVAAIRPTASSTAPPPTAMT